MSDDQGLRALGLPERVAAGAGRVYGSEATAVLELDPWSVLAIRGVRPEQADAYARTRLGSAARPDDPRRLAAIVTWLLRRASQDGHTLMPAPVVESALAAYGIADLAGAVTAAAGSVVTGPDGALALRPYAEAEQAIADAVAGAVAATPRAGGQPGAALDPVDLDQILDEHVATLTGLTRPHLDDALRTIAAGARARGLEVTAIAPTATAARRLSQLISAPASIDLQHAPGGGDPTGLVLVSDAQAMDVSQAATLVRAVAGRASLVFAGDVRALPPLDGPGNVLGDLVTSGRLASFDVEAAPAEEVAATIGDLGAWIGQGELPKVESPAKDIVVVPAASAQEAVRRTIQLVTDSIPRSFGIDADGVAVLAPAMRGVAGARALNRHLKAHLNPGRPDGFDAGDRVVVTEDLGDPTIRAGDVGTVLHASPDALLLRIAGGELRISPDRQAALRPAWALTVARAAVERWPACVLVLTADSVGLLSRALLRTAVSRAEQHLTIVHAAGPAVARVVRHGRERRRRTALPALLHEAIDRKVAAST